MGKKKKEHIVFDQMLKTKKSIPFTESNRRAKQFKAKESKIKMK